MNSNKQVFQIWKDRLQKLSDCGVCQGFMIDAQESSGGATIACYFKTKEQAKAVYDFVRADKYFYLDSQLLNTKENGGEQHIFQILIDY